MAKIDFQYGGWNSYTLHGGALRIHPTNNDLLHFCVAAFVPIFIAKTIQPWIRLLPMWMTACLLLFYRTISHVLRCILPECNTHSYSLRPRRYELVLTTKRDSRSFFKDTCFKICIDILFSCVLSTVFQRLKRSEVLCAMWLWNRDSEFTKWQYPAMWYVALGWNAIEFAQTSAILEFYIWFPFQHITAVSKSVVTQIRFTAGDQIISKSHLLIIWSPAVNLIISSESGFLHTFYLLTNIY